MLGNIDSVLHEAQTQVSLSAFSTNELNVHLNLLPVIYFAYVIVLQGLNVFVSYG